MFFYCCCALKYHEAANFLIGIAVKTSKKAAWFFAENVAVNACQGLATLTPLNHRLALVVEGRRGLVQEQDGRVAHQRTRNGDPLLLAAGELRSALAHRRVQARWQRLDKGPGVGALAGGHHVRLRGRPVPKQDVLAQAAVEEHRLLAHHPDVAAKPTDIEVAEITSVQQYCSSSSFSSQNFDALLLLLLGGIIEALDQLDAGGLAAARGAHQRHCLPAGHLQAEVVQHPDAGPRGIGEDEVAKRDIAHNREILE